MAIAGLYAGTLMAVATFTAVSAQTANAVGFLTALVAGYLVHSRWSFKGHGGRAHGISSARYLIVNLAGYALNCVWVWLVVDLLSEPVALTVIPIVTLTPALMFAFNRSWTFAGRA